MSTGLIVAAHGRHYLMECPDGQRLRAHPRGKRSDCVVGDRVKWASTGPGDQDEAVIESIEPRRNLLMRQDAWRTKSFAANIDQVLVLASSQPLFSDSQLGRALIAAEQAGIPAVIAHNKIDLEDATVARTRLAPYRAMGTEVLEMSVTQDPGGTLATLEPFLSGRATLLLGASGTGKSSLVNLLVPQASMRVGELSTALQAGRHTTTHTSWHWLDEARTRALIDSPGFQEFGLAHVQAADLTEWMPDLRPYRGQCRFANCTHRQEPDCAVTAARDAGQVAESRYRVYAEIYEELTRSRW